MLTLYQAEWCPYSSAVRQRLTELGIDFVAKQVAPRHDDRVGQHEIPLLTNGDGERFEGSDPVFGTSSPSPRERPNTSTARIRAHRPDRTRETMAHVLAEQSRSRLRLWDPRLERGGDRVAHGLELDPVEHFLEEAAHDQPLGLLPLQPRLIK